MDIRESIGNGDAMTIGGGNSSGNNTGDKLGIDTNSRDARLLSSSPSTSSLINSHFISSNHHPHNSINNHHPLQQQQQAHSSSYSSSPPNLLSDDYDDHDENKSPTFGRFLERNIIYLYEQFNKIIEGRGKGSRSPFVTSLCILLVVIYLINLSTSEWGSSGSTGGGSGTSAGRVTPESNSEFFWTSFDSPITEMFTLTPGNILSPRFWVWSAVSTITYPLIELHWWQVVNDVLAIYLSSTLIEPLWGSRELFSFFLIINLSVAFLTTSHYIILYSIYGSDEYLYNVRLYGCSAYCAAICVSIKQLLPESVLIGTPLGKFKNNNVPLAGLFVSLLLYLFNIIESSLVLMFFYGLLVSWIYLRFIQSHPNGHRGDLSDGFSFASFFPSLLKPVISIISNCVYSFFVAIRLCSPTDSRQYQPLRVLGERLNQEHDSQPQIPMRGHKFKHHQSGDYQYLSQPMHV